MTTQAQAGFTKDNEGGMDVFSVCVFRLSPSTMPESWLHVGGNFINGRARQKLVFEQSPKLSVESFVES